MTRHKRSRIRQMQELLDQGVIRLPHDHTVDAIGYAMGWDMGGQTVIDTDGYEVIPEPAALPEARD